MLIALEHMYTFLIRSLVRSTEAVWHIASRIASTMPLWLAGYQTTEHQYISTLPRSFCYGFLFTLVVAWRLVRTAHFAYRVRKSSALGFFKMSLFVQTNDFLISVESTFSFRHSGTKYTSVDCVHSASIERILRRRLNAKLTRVIVFLV